MLKQFESISDIESMWSSLLAKSNTDTIFLTPLWESVWWNHFSKGKTWHGLYLEKNRQIVGIAPMWSTGDTLSLIGNTETVDYNDFIILPEYAEEFLNSVVDHFIISNNNYLNLYSIHENSQTKTLLPKIAKEKGLTINITEEDVSPGIILPNTWDDFLAGLNKKDRHELRRKLRRLDTVENCVVQVIDDSDKLDEYFSIFIKLMKMSRTEKESYLDIEKESYFKSIFEIAADNKYLKLFLMSIDGTYASASLCFDYKGKRLLYNSGNNHDFDYYSVGLLLHSLAIKDAINNNFKYFDFLRGDEQYKYKLGGSNKQVYTLEVSKNDQ
ncbi:MAG TPA: hypothetical protein DEZ08_08445 [Dehalococcoidia bacterium]|jgi:CelD/BcsL family acetyltransferase involved in cellulose biosynthesis|nr:hypothetical protein [Dehalococcoidia bacterium]